jgi:hypothetical protein
VRTTTPEHVDPAGPSGAAEPVDPAPVRRLGRAPVAWRSAVLVLGTVLVIWGTVFGNDVDWPFGPMSQFAFRVGRDDAIRSTFLEARNARGEVMVVPITVHSLGIARAEIEGQQNAIIREPRLLGDLASSYHRLHPAEPELTQLWLNERVTVLRNGRAAGEHVDTLVGWPVNAPEVGVQ